MSAVVPPASHTDLPHLSLDSHPSSSPFPSPSSSFLPPPMPGAHEFASKPPPAGRNSLRKKESSEQPRKKDAEPAAPVNGTVPTPTTARPHPPHTPSPPRSPTHTPKRSSFPLPSERATAIPSAAAKHTSLSLSLSSTRPAPASPTLSRRASGATSSSRHSTASPPMSRRPSTRRSATLPNRRSLLSQSQTPTTPPPPKRAPAPIKIRDFAFPAGDQRHTGQGPDRQRLSTASVSSTASQQRNSGWGSFRWGFGSKLWGFGSASSGGSGFGFGGGPRDKGDVPSRSDFERNFDDEMEDSPSSSAYEDAQSTQDEDEGDDYDEGDGVYGHSEDVPLLPGLYRALYAFEPEGTAEMALKEDQEVRVIGRLGGGVGWAIVVRDDAASPLSSADVAPAAGVTAEGDGKHALVPESYLELVRLDANGS